ncbi:S-adenosyl-L-methionine-dependent methyltransferase [Tribonema minus]|uniref:S-adenosyl-L-methionine-dependent methyltransferase n=1 Tax=Tribonema minus TaxID=303371 RepID=A0A835Z4Q9_9STRA|nr:S-adenosyl-L-methionine-dependent methyltransferase [Tribonema minus]
MAPCDAAKEQLTRAAVLLQKDELAAADEACRRALAQFAQHLRSIGDHAQALHEFERAAALDPANQLAAFWQSVAAKGTGASASGGGDVPAPPREYIEKLYDGYAAKFEEHLTKGLQYKTHELLVEALVKALPGRLWARCVDLGCGTGLSGVTARPHVEHLTGVDLSKNMIAQARAKGTAVYNRLIVGECAEALMDLGTDLGTEGGKGAERFDLFLSCDVFVYIGDLQPCFTAMAATAAPGAVIAFSPSVIRKQANKPVNGYLIIAQRQTPADRVDLRGLSLAVDGVALCYHMITIHSHSASPCLCLSLGGDYRAFTAHITRYLQALLSHDVTLHVVLDGMQEADKAATTRDRRRAQVQEARDTVRCIARCGVAAEGAEHWAAREKLLPLFATECLARACSALGVGCVVAAREADRRLALIARW